MTEAHPVENITAETVADVCFEHGSKDMDVQLKCTPTKGDSMKILFS